MLERIQFEMVSFTVKELKNLLNVVGCFRAFDHGFYKTNLPTTTKIFPNHAGQICMPSCGVVLLKAQPS